MNFAPAGALTSCDTINGGGSSTLGGKTFDNFTGTFTGLLSVVSSSPSSITQSMATDGADSNDWPIVVKINGSSDLVGYGTYVKINNYTYKVIGATSKSEILLTLTGNNNIVPSGTNISGSIIIIPSGVREKPYATANNSYIIPISDPTAFIVGDTAYFRDSTGKIAYNLSVIGKGYLNNKDVESGYIEVTPKAIQTGEVTSRNGVTLQVPSAGNITSLAIGWPLYRYVAAAASDNTVPSGFGSSKTVGGELSNYTPLKSTCSPANNLPDSYKGLFSLIFNGLSVQDYYNLTRESNRYLNTSAISGPLKGDLYWFGNPPGGGLTSHTVNNNQLCGSGIMVINGNLDLSGTGNLDAYSNTCTTNGSTGAPRGFTGIIYVIGDFKNSGNSTITGSIVVEGKSIGDTSVTGSMDITYDPSVLLVASKALSPMEIYPVPNTWRQK